MTGYGGENVRATIHPPVDQRRGGHHARAFLTAPLMRAVDRSRPGGTV
jgi:hypothetical protein